MIDELYAVLFALAIALCLFIFTLLLYKFTKKLSTTKFIITVVLGIVVKFAIIITIFTTLKPISFFDHHTFSILLVILVISSVVIEAIVLSRKKDRFFD